MSETIRTTRTTLDLHKDSVVASLRKLLEADRYDWVAKNQLRLVSIASGLCEQVEFRGFPLRTDLVFSLRAVLT